MNKKGIHGFNEILEPSITQFQTKKRVLEICVPSLGISEINITDNLI